jgi:choline kinase
MSNIKHVVISAAGLGSRLGMDIPKCLIPLRGKTLIEYQLALLENVPDVRIVVGFKEQDVIKHVGKRWRNVTFARNPQYASTSNTYSLALGSKYLSEPFIAIDGDLIIEPSSFRTFLDMCENSVSSIVGIVERSTEDAVGVQLDEHQRVIRFLRYGDPGFAETKYEWCGIAYFNDLKIDISRRFVYEAIAPHLPLVATLIKCAEIDTPRDLELATKFAALFS